MINTSLDNLLSFYGLSKSSKFKELQDFLIETNIIDAIMDDFYDYIQTFGKMVEVIKASNRTVEDVKIAQKKHWDMIFDQGFDDNYEQRVKRIGLSHVKVGLTPEWYIGGYNRVQQTLLSEVKKLDKGGIFRKAKYSQEQIDKFVETFFIISNIDMSISISAYIDLSNKKTEEIIAIQEVIKEQISLGITESTQATSDVSQSIGTILQENQNCQDLIKISKESLAELLTTSQEFNKDIEEIKGILKFIQEISEKTNLLSLNASIEAARAGDAGRGFAVVASEVKKLADQTNKSVNNIGNSLGKVLTGSSQISTSIEQVEELSSQVVSSNTVVSDMISSQSAAIEQITSTMESLDSLARQS